MGNSVVTAVVMRKTATTPFTEEQHMYQYGINTSVPLRACTYKLVTFTGPLFLSVLVHLLLRTDKGLRESVGRMSSF